MNGSGDTNPTPDVLARAKAALEGVTPGRWVHYYPDQCCNGHCVGEDPELGKGGVMHDACVTHVDAEFIAASRQLVPELVAEVERLRQLVNEMAAQR